jgi:di/tricarboxylate transporter
LQSVPPNWQAAYTGIVVLMLIFTLYRNLLRPSLAFLMAVGLLIGAGVVSVAEMISGLANKQILVIFLLMVLTAGLRNNLGNAFFFKIFRKELSPFVFRLRMMGIVATVSSVLNNTPVVAFMIPYVKTWAEEKQYPVSKFLIPLSFAAIIGGMITVVGTSTNLVLNGLIAQSGLPLLQFKDFFFLGVLVTISGIVYMAFFSEKLLPGNKSNREGVLEHIQDYLVETVVDKGSTLIGKTIEEAGLRHLKTLFLVEIKRGERLISAVDPNRLLQEGDRLFFAGNTQAILNLINEKNGLILPEENYISKNRFFELTEAIIPTGSALVGQSLKSSNFRDTYKGSVISIQRNKEKVNGNLGEIKLKAGDLLLMLVNGEKEKKGQWKDLILLKKKGLLENQQGWQSQLLLALSVLFLLMGVLGFLDLFIAVVLGILVQVLGKLTDLEAIKKALDLELLIVLVSALALGIAINNSGAAAILIQHLFAMVEGLPLWGSLGMLFASTLLLTSLITNAAAVSIMFPFAYQMASTLEVAPTPYFLAIAFAASADFMTPIGYQTNLMVMGPGNYTFKDYTRIGFPLTLVYSFIVLFFIHQLYLS